MIWVLPKKACICVGWQFGFSLYVFVFMLQRKKQWLEANQWSRDEKDFLLTPQLKPKYQSHTTEYISILLTPFAPGGKYLQHIFLTSTHQASPAYKRNRK